MTHQLKSQSGRELYGRRKCTVEPVFGIIKQVLGFRQFLMREIQAVVGEWRRPTILNECMQWQQARKNRKAFVQMEIELKNSDKKCTALHSEALKKFQTDKIEMLSQYLFC